MENKHKIYLQNSRYLRSNMTIAEQSLWSKIRRKQLKFRFLRQYIVDNLYIVDFICLEKRLIIEIDGGQHCENLSDIKRDNYLKSKNFKVLRFWNNEIMENINGCLEKIKENLGNND
mgnify:CR=1 FL=1